MSNLFSFSFVISNKNFRHVTSCDACSLKRRKCGMTFAESQKGSGPKRSGATRTKRRRTEEGEAGEGRRVPNWDEWVVADAKWKAEDARWKAEGSKWRAEDAKWKNDEARGRMRMEHGLGTAIGVQKAILMRSSRLVELLERIVPAGSSVGGEEREEEMRDAEDGGDEENGADGVEEKETEQEKEETGETEGKEAEETEETGERTDVEMVD